MYHEEIHVPTLPWKLTIVPTTLLTFFLVFYTRDCFQRYYDLYKHCMGMTGRVIEFAGLLRSHCPKADADALFNLCRYPLASVYVLYFMLSGGGSDGGKIVTESEWCVWDAHQHTRIAHIHVTAFLGSFSPLHTHCPLRQCPVCSPLDIHHMPRHLRMSSRHLAV
jgi:hypothetical protein